MPFITKIIIFVPNHVVVSQFYDIDDPRNCQGIYGVRFAGPAIFLVRLCSPGMCGMLQRVLRIVRSKVYLHMGLCLTHVCCHYMPPPIPRWKTNSLPFFLCPALTYSRPPLAAAIPLYWPICSLCVRFNY